MNRRIEAVVALLPLLGPVAAADVLCLTDGRVFDGFDMERVEEGVRIHFENGEVTVPADLVQDVIIEGQTTFVPRTEEEEEKLAKGLVPYKDRWVSIPRRDRLVERELEERREAIEEMLSHRVWRNRYEEETKNFRFFYTVPEYICAGYRDRMEAYFEIFRKEWRVRRDRRKPKLAVNFYGDRDEFNRVSGAGGGTLAYFMFVGDYDLNVFYDRLDPELTEAVLYHEANHYLQKLVNEDFRMPHWPGEALAEYYGASRWDPEREELEVGLLQEGRLAEIQSDLAADERMSLRKLITEDLYEDYNWGWSLVHFLLNDERYAKDFRKFFVGLANDRDVETRRDGYNLKYVTGEEVLRVFMDYLDLDDEDDLQALEREWHAYVEGLFDELSPRGLEKAAISAQRTGRRLRAKRLFQEALDAGSLSPYGHHRYAELLTVESRDSAIEHWRKAIELDPLTGIYYYALGAAVGGEEGDRLKALAKEIDPEAGTYTLWR